MLNNIFDSHAHYDDRRFDEDRELVLAGLPSKGVSAVMTCGSDLATSEASRELAEQYGYIYFAAGVHPHVAENAPESMETEIKKLAEHPKMRAVGEIGLDYYYDHSPREKQKQVFIRQIKTALELSLPVIVHDREAHQDTFDILKEHKPRGVIHSYSGSGEMAEEYVKLDFYLGFTGVITFKNAVKPLEAIEATPLNRLLVETDCPYLAPVPYRGKRSDSTMITATIAKMAEIKKVTPQEMLDITGENACRLFGINM